MPAFKRRIALQTVLVVGEGKTEEAFLRYIKSLYIYRGCGVAVTIRNAHGKGPNHVVDFAIRQCRNADYDRVVALLDNDLEMSATVGRRAKTRKVQIIRSTPCIEGLLLKILGAHVPATTSECKGRCGIELPENLTSPRNYMQKFPKHILDAQCKAVPELARLLANLTASKT